MTALTLTPIGNKQSSSLYFGGGREGNIFHNRQSMIDIATFHEPHNNIGYPPDEDGDDGGFSLPRLCFDWDALSGSMVTSRETRW